MKKPKQEDIPKTVIKGSGVVHADLNSPKGKGDLLFLSPKCTVIGLNNIPYMLFATPEFNESELPSNLKKEIYEIKEIVLQTSFLTDVNKMTKYNAVPRWLANFQNTESLVVEFVDLEDLDHIKDMPIQKITFKNVTYSDEDKIIEVIKQLKHLNEVYYDQSFSFDLVLSLNKLNLKSTLID